MLHCWRLHGEPSQVDVVNRGVRLILQLIYALILNASKNNCFDPFQVSRFRHRLFGNFRDLFGWINNAHHYRPDGCTASALQLLEL